MSSVQRAVKIAHVQIEEAEATVRIRYAYKDFVVLNAQSLYSIFRDEKECREKLSKALKDKDTDTSILFRGLIVQLIGIFENFIRLLCEAVVKKKSTDAGTYSALDETIRNEHLCHSAKILTHLKKGHVNGIKYDFSRLQVSLANCILDTSNFNVQPDVFTLLMGNCRSSRLVDLFRSLSLPDPFDASLGGHSELRKCTNEQSKKRVAEFAKLTLDKHIDLRNDIAHGNLTRSVSKAEFDECVKFFKALIKALSQKISNDLENN